MAEAKIQCEEPKFVFKVNKVSESLVDIEVQGVHDGNHEMSMLK